MIVARQPILEAVARAQQLDPQLGLDAAIEATAQALRLPAEVVREALEVQEA